MKPKQRKYILEHMHTMSSDDIARKLNVKPRTVNKFLNSIDFKPTSKVAPEPVKSTPLKRGKLFWISMIVVFALGILVYANTFGHEFVWDDVNLVQSNPVIRSWSYLPEVLTENLGIGVIQLKSSSFRPLQTVTYMLDYSFWKMDPMGFHITNTVLHALVGVCVFLVIATIFSNQWIGLMTAVLFVVHPIHTEAVAYVSGRADPLSAIFILLSFWLYIKYVHEKSVARFVGILFLFGLAIFSRESALIILPASILVYSFTLKKKLDWPVFLSTLGMIAVYIILRKLEILGAIRQLGTNPPTLDQRLPGFFVALTKYVQLIPFPVNLHMEYGRPVFQFTNPQAIVGFLILFVLIVLIVFTYKRAPLICFGLTWFLAGILPVSNIIVVVNAFMAEHWLYLPSIGIFLIAAKGIHVLCLQPKLRVAAITGFIFVAGTLGFLTVKQNKVWAESVSFYEYTMQFAPKSARLNADLGVAYYNAGRKEDAINSFKKAIQLNPYYAFAFNNLGAVYNSMKRYEEAIIPLQKAVAYQKSYAVGYYNLGNSFKALKRFDEASAAYLNAIQINPNYAEAYNNLAITKSHSGKKEEAIVFYKKAIELSPQNIRIYNNLASVYSGLGKIQEALRTYERATTLEASTSDRAILLGNLGITYTNLGRSEEAISAFKQSIKLNKESWKSYRHLAGLYQKLGRKEEAQQVVALFNKAKSGQ